MQAHHIAVVNQKGGVGKTTLAMNIAAGISERVPAMVVDLDPQGSAQAWGRFSPQALDLQVEHIHGNAVTAQALEAQKKEKNIIVDCPPTLDGDAITAVLSSVERVVIPVLPSPLDLWSSLQLAKWVETAQKENPRLEARLVINQLEPRSALSGAMETALREFSIPTLRTAVRRRAIYRSTAMEGLTVFQIGRNGAAAREEINAIIDEVMK
ncbi:ParA family partition ATPase [Acidihalobacter prosperus]